MRGAPGASRLRAARQVVPLLPRLARAWGHVLHSMAVSWASAKADLGTPRGRSSADDILVWASGLLFFRKPERTLADVV